MRDRLASFLRPRVRSGDRLLVAFSGGPDSTALLLALAELAPGLGVSVLAAHLDHRLDADSPRRAGAARAIAARLGVACVCGEREVAALRRRGESLEEAARRVRYDFLETAAGEAGARYVLTAHHRDDQAETVLLRLRQGSGLAGLAAVREERGRLLRPLLPLARAELAAAVEASGLEPLDDPGNRDLARARNFVRHRLLPALTDADPGLTERLAAVAAAMGGALPVIGRRLEEALAPRRLEAGGLEVERRRLLALPASLRGLGLAHLAERAGAPQPPSRRAQRELWRQAESGGAIGCDCGHGWHFAARGDAVELRPAAAPTGAFTYTFAVPGHCDVAEVGWRVHLRPAPVEPWMYRGDRRRAGLAAELRPGDAVEVRNRRPGDRVQPLGGPGSRHLKELLIDRRVPRAERDRLPLLCIAGRIAWVPGVTVAEAFRLRPGTATWLAEIEEL